MSAPPAVGNRVGQTGDRRLARVDGLVVSQDARHPRVDLLFRRHGGHTVALLVVVVLRRRRLPRRRRGWLAHHQLHCAFASVILQLARLRMREGDAPRQTPTRVARVLPGRQMQRCRPRWWRHVAAVRSDVTL